jgi:hypothetical protein
MTQRIIKRVSDPYQIVRTQEPTLVDIGKIGADTAEVTIWGNLSVKGTTTTISSTDTTIADNIITLNNGETGQGVSLNVAGLQVDRGQLSAVGLYWNELLQNWQISNSTGLFSNIATFPSGSLSFITKVEEDIDPHLGGNLNTNGFSITSLPSANLILSPPTNVQIDAPIIMSTTVTPPTSGLPNYNALYSGQVKDGETGLYVTNEKASNQELITKRKAIVYSLIF